MDLEKQVCSLQLAKRLKELGVPQESLYYWHRDLSTGEYRLTVDIIGNQPPRVLVEPCSAFTVAELLEIAGSQTQLWKHPASYVVEHFITGKEQFTSENPADALAQLIIKLYEHGAIR